MGAGCCKSRPVPRSRYSVVKILDSKECQISGSFMNNNKQEKGKNQAYEFLINSKNKKYSQNGTLGVGYAEHKGKIASMDDNNRPGNKLSLDTNIGGNNSFTKFKPVAKSAQSFHNISSSKVVEDGKDTGSDQTPSNLTSLADAEERGSMITKFSNLKKREQIDDDKILSQLIDSNCQHSYHSNFKDSLRNLSSPMKKRKQSDGKEEHVISKISEVVDSNNSVSAKSLNSGASPKHKEQKEKTSVEQKESGKTNEDAKETLKIPTDNKTMKDFDFHLLEVIGKGKISMVYKGVNLLNGCAIAIKYMEHRKPS